MGVTLRRSVRSVKKTATAARRGTPEIVGLRRHEPPIGPLWAARIELFLARNRPFSENQQCFQRTRALTRAAGRDLSFSTDRRQLLATVLTPWRVGRGVATGPPGAIRLRHAQKGLHLSTLCFTFPQAPDFRGGVDGQVARRAGQSGGPEHGEEEAQGRCEA